ncbi:MAG: hypothetical protein GY771_14790 [bacterium]|nr:hypothetical protein [bacterium]
MKHLLVLTVIFATAAFGAMDTHLEGDSNGSGEFHRDYNNSDVIVDNLVTSYDQVKNGYSLYGPDNSWCAIDWVVSDNDWVFRRWTHDIITFGSWKYDLFIELYEIDFNSDPVDSFTIPRDEITSTNTGIGTFEFPVIRNGMDVFSTVYPFFENTTYWIACSYDASHNIYWVVREDSIVDDYIWFYDGSDWYSAPDFFGENAEGSFMIEGIVYSAVEGASLGEIKASFR